jgi:hypothetical protein
MWQLDLIIKIFELSASVALQCLFNGTAFSEHGLPPSGFFRTGEP